MLELDREKVKQIVENLLFVAREPLAVKEMKKIIGVDAKTVEDLMEELISQYNDRGLQIMRIAGGYQLCTRAEYAEYVDAVLNAPIEAYLSPASMETLSIVAYRQPITRLDIERIRGVNCDSVLLTLLDRSLIAEVGRGEGVGRPILYGTTEPFLKHFGLESIKELPPLPALGGREEIEAETAVLRDREGERHGG